MTYDLNRAVTTFVENRKDAYEMSNITGSFQERIQFLKDQFKLTEDHTYHKPSVVILGGGPGGLIRTMQSLLNNNPTTLLEMRAEDNPGRDNMVILKETTVSMLKYCGAYQYLIENKLIYPEDANNEVMVSLVDLERAIKEVIKAISPPHFAIEYNSKVVEIDWHSNKIALAVEDTITKKQRIIKEVEILVNAEGKNSSTNVLLGIKREEVLPEIPAVFAFYEDKRTEIGNFDDLMNYVELTFIYLAETIYYHAKFFFEYIASDDFQNQFHVSVILKTPQQNYVSSSFSNKINNQFDSFKQRIQQKKSALEENDQTVDEIAKKNGELEKLEEEYQAFANEWIHHSVCYANLLAIQAYFQTGKSLYTGGHLSLKKFVVIQISADRATQYYTSIKDTSVLLAGDASATVDPVTGLGCNAAIQSSVDFLAFIWDYDISKQQDLLGEYHIKTKARVKHIHERSKAIRGYYRPDALAPKIA